MSQRSVKLFIALFAISALIVLSTIIFVSAPVLLQLRAETDNIGASSLYVDDVAWQNSLTAVQ